MQAIQGLRRQREWLRVRPASNTNAPSLFTPYIGIDELAQFLVLFREGDEDKRLQNATDFFGQSAGCEVIKRRLWILFQDELYRFPKIRKHISARKRLDVIAKALAVVLRRSDASKIVCFLRKRCYRRII